MNFDIKAPKYPTHAVKRKDNWDGEGDMYFSFAFKVGDVFYCHDTNKPILEYVGDEILNSWELNHD